MVWLYLILCMVGLLCIFSVEYRGEGNVLQSFLDFKREYSKQFFFLGRDGQVEPLAAALNH